MSVDGASAPSFFANDGIASRSACLRGAVVCSGADCFFGAAVLLKLGAVVFFAVSFSSITPPAEPALLPMPGSVVIPDLLDLPCFAACDVVALGPGD